ncbi:MAG: hypothetical protein AB8H86_09720 [Polyangiales bacterium]
MTSSARARAAVGLTLLSTLERDHADLAAEVRAKLSDTTRKEYDTVATLLWISMSSHMDLSDRIRDALGSDNEDFWRRVSFALLQRPMLGYVQRFTKLLSSPERVFCRVTPMIMPQLFENIGTMSMELVDDQEHFAECVYRGFPKEFTLMCFVEGLSGALAAAGPVVGIDVKVTRLSVDPAGDFRLAIAML